MTPAPSEEWPTAALFDLQDALVEVYPEINLMSGWRPALNALKAHLARLREVEEALKEFLDSCAYPEFDDVRLDYISVQIHRNMLAQGRAALTQ